jgi:hypothetical protein
VRSRRRATDPIPTDDAEKQAPEEESQQPDGEQQSQAAAEQPEKVEQADHYAVLKELDPDEAIRRDSRFAGKVGELADRIYQRRKEQDKEQLKNELREELRREQEEAELARLKDEDEIQYFRKKEEREQRKRTEEEEQTTRQKIEADAIVGAVTLFDTRVLKRLFNELPEEAQTKFPKTFEGDTFENRLAFLRQYAKSYGEIEVAKARAKWEKEDRPALKKQILTELNGNSGGYDVEGGSPSGGGDFATQEEFNANRKDRAWLVANKSRVDKGINLGKITY